MKKSETKPSLANRIDQHLASAEDHLDQKVRRRPLWQRIILPLVGVVLVVAGIFFLFTPIPLAILAVIGFPFLFCFHPRIEKRAREWMVSKIEALRRWVRSKRKSPRTHP